VKIQSVQGASLTRVREEGTLGVAEAVDFKELKGVLPHMLCSPGNGPTRRPSLPISHIRLVVPDSLPSLPGPSLFPQLHPPPNTRALHVSQPVTYQLSS
jgi:hypothetical protein